MVAMATGGATWGAGVVPLRGGARFRVSARWRSTTGGQGWWLIEEKGRGKGVLQGLASGSSSCLRSNQIRQVVDLWQDLLLGFV
jgi:hypothetical protein